MNLTKNPFGKKLSTLAMMLYVLILTQDVFAQYYTDETSLEPVVYYPSGTPGSLFVPPPPSSNSTFLFTNSRFEVNYIGAWTVDAKAAFAYTLSIWEQTIGSPIPIHIRAEYKNFTQDNSLPNNALAGAYPRLLAGGQFGQWHPSALVEKIIEQETDVTKTDITITINSAANWYYGTDGNVPFNQYDFVTTILHEIGHGLGYTSSVRLTQSGLIYGDNGYHTIYDEFVKNGSGTLLRSFPKNTVSSAFTSYVTSNDLFWGGTHGFTARLYAPSTFQQGSSISHLNESTYTNDLNALMTPALDPGVAIHNPGGLVRGILRDIGWDVNPILGIEDELHLRAHALINNNHNHPESDFTGGNLPSGYNYIDFYSEFDDNEPYGDYMVSRTFELIAEHSQGEYVVKSSTSSYLHVVPSDFNLPSGYDWKRTLNGKVKTKVILKGYDSDNVFHKDGFYIYVPQQPSSPTIELLSQECDEVSVAFNATGASTYRVYYNKVGMPTSYVNVDGDIHNYTFSDLDLEAEYDIYVLAMSGQGNVASDPISVSTSCDLEVSTNALTFDRTQLDRVSVPHLPDYSLGTGDFTVEAWVKFDGVQSSYPSIFSNRSGHSSGFLMYCNGQGKLVANLNGSNYTLNSSVNLRDGICHHVVVVRNGTQIHFYIDGELLQTTSIGLKNITTGHDLWIGHDWYTSTTAFNGSIKEVRFWNTARTESQVQNNMTSVLSGSELGLLGYWRFNEGSGQVVADESSYSNDGYLGSSISVENMDPTWDSNDCGVVENVISANGLEFDRSSDTRVEIDHSTIYDIGTGEFTVEAWVKYDGAQDTYPAIFSNRASGFSGFLMYTNPQGEFWVNFDGSNYGMSGSASLYDGNCHHLAFTRTDTDMKWFVDGVLMKTSGLSSKDLSTTHDIWIGHDVSTYNTALNGSIQEVRFWNVSRNESEIDVNKDLQLSGSETGLIGYWKMDEGTGQTVSDYSPNGNDGRLGSTISPESNDPVWTAVSCGSSSRFSYNEQNETTISDLISVYPNPFNDQLNIQLGTVDVPVTIEVLDSKGSVIYKKEVESDVSIDESWTAGIYLIRAISGNDIEVLKVIKK